MSTATLKITGMSCSHCVRAITQALEQVPGVTRAVVDLSGARAVVEYDAAQTTPRALANVVMDEGYVAEELG
jgi:copper chaperone CopZ